MKKQSLAELVRTTTMRDISRSWPNDTRVPLILLLGCLVSTGFTPPAAFFPLSSARCGPPSKTYIAGSADGRNITSSTRVCQCARRSWLFLTFGVYIACLLGVVSESEIRRIHADAHPAMPVLLSFGGGGFVRLSRLLPGTLPVRRAKKTKRELTNTDVMDCMRARTGGLLALQCKAGRCASSRCRKCACSGRVG